MHSTANLPGERTGGGGKHVKNVSSSIFPVLNHWEMPRFELHYIGTFSLLGAALLFLFEWLCLLWIT